MRGQSLVFQKLQFLEPIVTDNLIIKILECRKEPYIEKIEVVATGSYRVK